MVLGIPFTKNANQTNVREFNTPEQIRNFLKIQYSSGLHFGTDNLTTHGRYREMGFEYDFRGYLVHFLVKMHHGGYFAAWGPNKKGVRNALHLKKKDKVWKHP